MFKKVQVRLTFFSALVMGLILLIMTCLCLAFSENSMRSRNETVFRNNASSILSYIDNQRLLSHTWLSQMEHNYGIMIDILDNGAPLLYSTLHAHDLNRELLETARSTAVSEYGLDPETFRSSSVLYRYEAFSVTDDSGKEYFVMASLMPRGSGYLDIVILCPASLPAAQLWQQRLFFGAGSAVAWIILTVLAWFFVARMLRPIENSRRRQVEFIASASHELRSPLTVMLSALSAARTASPDEQPRFFDSIESEGQRMARLIEDMLLLASSDSKTWSIRPGMTELDTLLLETYEKYEPTAREKKLHLQIHLPEDALAPCFCDKERIGQTLSILIDNAFSYTPPGGTVCLSAGTADKYFTISVADNGPGIPDDQKEKIFDRFYRADDARSNRGHFGLGLCIAKEIVLLHKGTLTVTDAPEGGAVFTILLPQTGK